MWYQNSISNKNACWAREWSENQAILQQLTGFRKFLFLLGL